MRDQQTELDHAQELVTDFIPHYPGKTVSTKIKMTSKQSHKKDTKKNKKKSYVAIRSYLMYFSPNQRDHQSTVSPVPYSYFHVLIGLPSTQKFLPHPPHCGNSHPVPHPICCGLPNPLPTTPNNPNNNPPHIDNHPNYPESLKPPLSVGQHYNQTKLTRRYTSQRQVGLPQE